ncbi:MAG: tetratricopeptide repeat protein [Candidatus Riflebacteria bacterium]|nr:tetratricopeptide repeat protein [Candidatus Riflebacteria bacterium]
MLKKIARVLMITALVVVTVPIFARTGVVRGSYINLRSEGRFNSPIVGKKMRGESYRVLFEGKSWLKVAFEDGTEGWLYQTSTERTADLPSEPAAESASATVVSEKVPEAAKVAVKKEPKPKTETKSEPKIKPKEAAKEKAVVDQGKAVAKPVPASVVEVSGSAEELYNEAIRLYEKKQYVPALDKNMQAIKKAPQNAEILNNVGNCQFKLGRIDEALESWKNALKISPRSGKISNNLGIAYYQLDKNKDAIEYYKKAILFEPDFPDPYYNLGSVYGFSGKFEDAILNYRKFLEFSPDATMKKLADERIAYCERQLEKTAKKN